MNPLHALLQRPDVWRGGQRAHDYTAPVIVSGHPGLDSRLPGGGWPVGALTELLSCHRGIGELRLLLPALARLSRQGWLVWVGPPHRVYAPALARAGIDLSRVLVVESADPIQQLWALEQTLRSGVCAAALAWPRRVEPRSLRRLQLAAETGTALGFLFRPLEAAKEASPAALRLQLDPTNTGTCITFLKQRGGWNHAPVILESTDAVA